ncbi:hypothetical protein HZ326_1472 [Fusarium oxysporum f. sp. albedinis]|nr:hypothetical protein HZ326_1472 [Fusarium oxysporum f. sp. albedinis]
MLWPRLTNTDEQRNGRSGKLERSMDWVHNCSLGAVTAAMKSYRCDVEMCWAWLELVISTKCSYEFTYSHVDTVYQITFRDR